MTQERFRAAAIKADRDQVDAIRAYLPANYTVRMVGGGEVVVGGHDNAGWTLDGYVLPRLASGLYFGEEIELEASA